ncbi:hypothetical protein ACFVIM_23095 [Streptomyces sp. NPDC057638]|uniref:hypothetical protein n=1 Tax=Streptomyces sp. NPDC057638 TaxID=3346190 RepID=UPI0036BDDE11
MLWWLRVRRGPVLLPPALAVFLGYVLLVRNETVALPSLIGGGAEVVLLAFAPIPVTSALMAALDTRLDAAEESGIRPVAALDAALALAVTAAATLLGLLAAWLLDQPGALAAGRDTAFLAGLMLCLRPLAGAHAVLAPVGWLMLSVLAGTRAGGEPHPWTVVRQPPDSWTAALTSALVLIAGTTAVAALAQRRGTRRER